MRNINKFCSREDWRHRFSDGVKTIIFWCVLSSCKRCYLNFWITCSPHCNKPIKNIGLLPLNLLWQRPLVQPCDKWGNQCFKLCLRTDSKISWSISVLYLSPSFSINQKQTSLRQTTSQLEAMSAPSKTTSLTSSHDVNVTTSSNDKLDTPTRPVKRVTFSEPLETVITFSQDQYVWNNDAELQSSEWPPFSE